VAMRTQAVTEQAMGDCQEFRVWGGG